MKKKVSIAPRLVMVSSGKRTASRDKVIEDWMNGARVILHIPRRGKPDKPKPFYNRRRAEENLNTRKSVYLKSKAK